MKILFRPTALAQLNAIFNAVAAHNHAAADRVISSIKRSIDRLADFPYSARASAVAGIRELPIVRYPYIAFYSVDDNAQAVIILRVRHAAQDPERHLG